MGEAGVEGVRRKLEGVDASAAELDVLQSMLAGIAPGIVEFVFGVDADDLARLRGQSDRDRARPAADVEHA